MKTLIISILFSLMITGHASAGQRRCTPPQGVQNQDLFYAIYARDINWLKSILRSGIGPSNVTIDHNRAGVSMTATMFAANWNEPEALQILIDFGADIKCTNEAGLSAWDYTRNEFHYKKVREILKKNGLGN